ncbi:hypothetical protein [Mycolicibacterium holsaticum]|uniref:Secreted protein n=1 Tax=Mycolicibacterium holsaticum TaxID=152142 RepID=A0A1E3RWW1_9MYCO|nr:hypothetical protein [Mycolicibacterium holsaticum]MDA4106705.1 hypothetical protein [Mycolicibacterium holsaticum DSM 44478 = JCM 12374]ODQ94340.1 hypothetical protein BHQ17_09490 [Mycolicibacterium holsaticum]QZA13020.1 hypothetical protein K3U96_02145 [Mycolicibacterium holsaticum DSM 44478 = JCM 12374]UNC09504.1 hypothetical protein H5U41_24675 [Mycolicibacterium holsaticum DSM 44478 = JCM 12374]
MKKLLTAGTLVLGTVTGTAVAYADDIVLGDENGVAWSWATEADCMRDGPDMALDNAADEARYRYWYCSIGDDGLWYLHNTDTPTG